MGSRRKSVNRLVARTVEKSFKPREYDDENETRRMEKELAFDDARPPKSKINRIRHKGGLLLHSKQILLAVVLLNLVDCVLVLGELILDIHYIKGLVEQMDKDASTFIVKMEEKNPDIGHYHVDNIHLLYQQIVEANCSFSANNNNLSGKTGFNTSAFSTVPTTGADFFKSRRLFATSSNGGDKNLADGENNAVDHVPELKEPHSDNMWEYVAHGLHKASITILGILFVENVLKVFFMGRAFFIQKFEVFDFFIVTASFVLDIVFLKGLTVYRIQDGILILSFLVPWRVLRVVNSLIVAVLDHEHFRLKMMYKKKKTISAELKAMKNLEKEFQLHLKKVVNFCLSEGIPQWKVDHNLRFHRNPSALSSMASLTLGSMLSGLMGDSPNLTRKPSPNLTPIQETKINGGDTMASSWRSLDSQQSLDSGRGSIIEYPDSLTSRSDDGGSSRGSSASTGTVCDEGQSTNADVERGDITSTQESNSDNNNYSENTRL